MNEKGFGFKILGMLGVFVSLLSPAGCIFFLTLTRNSFCLDQFGTQHTAVCLILSLISMVWCLFLSLPVADGKAERSRIMMCVVLVLGAIGWILALSQGWPDWEAAAQMERISHHQLHRLVMCSSVGIITSLLPTAVCLLRNIRKNAL